MLIFLYLSWLWQFHVGTCKYPRSIDMEIGAFNKVNFWSMKFIWNFISANLILNLSYNLKYIENIFMCPLSSKGDIILMNAIPLWYLTGSRSVITFKNSKSDGLHHLLIQEMWKLILESIACIFIWPWHLLG